MIGFGDVHARMRICQAILEGLTYALHQGRERIEKRSDTSVVRLRVAGGGSQSDAVMQFTTDIFSLPAKRPHACEASGLGVAIDCTVGLGLCPNVASAMTGMIRVGRALLPQTETRQIYQRFYGEVYLYMYHQLHPLYHSIREITGCPA